MNARQRMMSAYTLKPVDHPPHFEHMFELEKEAFGLEFPDRRLWETVGAEERKRMVSRCMEVYAKIIEVFRWDALPVFWPWSSEDGVTAARKQFGDRVLVGTLVGGSLWCIDTIKDWEQFALDLYENPKQLHEEAERKCRGGLAVIDKLVDAGAEFISLVHDVASNMGPFCSKPHFDEFVTPYLARLVDRVKSRGAYCTVHSDGMLMPIWDSLMSTKPHMIHSLDPMAGMDIVEVRRITRGKLALMGNVRCDALQTGPVEMLEESTRYCLNACGREPGYVFSSSNTIFPGMPLENYKRMLEMYWTFCDELKKERA
ncbi:MAG: hypothetical protein IT440_07000 [Phycisphaeraceae bacterium]|nr:hypothetical protein [Phycisphaeraceae bacterium]